MEIKDTQLMLIGSTKESPDVIGVKNVKINNEWRKCFKTKYRNKVEYVPIEDVMVNCSKIKKWLLITKEDNNE